mmetsp:Transcript_11332/g.21612  ORF Transcript_11332/g.21612 Transcript_11332/m.21612 type:complete len:500 (-) Transcript_11332:297-1796(-)
MPWRLVRRPCRPPTFGLASTKTTGKNRFPPPLLSNINIRYHSTAKSALSAVSSYNDRIPDDIYDLVNEYARKSQSPASLQKLLRTGEGELLTKACQREAPLGALGKRLVNRRICIQSAQFLRRELPIRLAHRIIDLENVPLLRDMPSVQRVKGIYIDSFMDLLHHPAIHTEYDEDQFAKNLHTLYDKHSSVLVDLAKGAYELREATRNGILDLTPRRSTAEESRSDDWAVGGEMERVEDEEEYEAGFEQFRVIHAFLDRFYMSRIGIRVLAGHYLALRAPARPNHVGMICKVTSPYECVERAAGDATGMCERQYGMAPAIRIEGNLDLTFPYIPTYLHYILLELLKNALRATAETHRNSLFLPPVTVVIADGRENEDVVIKIMDEGGGIPRSKVSKVWSYLYTTADPSIQANFVGDGATDHGGNSPIAGLGYGLPIARSYCRYFGGELDLISMEGYGTDAFIHLRRLGDVQEPVSDVRSRSNKTTWNRSSSTTREAVSA